MADIITSGAMYSIKSLFLKKKEKNTIIDPFSCLVKLSLLKFQEPGTKISIYQNRINFNNPNYAQGLIRFIYGDGREDLHNIYQPIQKCVEWYWNNNDLDMIYMFKNAVNGLKLLKTGYSAFATIQHTLDYYIIVLMQKNTDLINNDIQTTENDLQSRTDRIDNGKINVIMNGLNNNSPNLENKKKKHKNDGSNHITNNPINNNSINITKQPESIEINKNDEIVSNNPNENISLKDIHKFLYDLWSEREMKIVINLFKEIDNKKDENEKIYLFTNIMKMCEMKENKLFEYIEENSSIL